MSSKILRIREKKKKTQEDKIKIREYKNISTKLKQQKKKTYHERRNTKY